MSNKQYKGDLKGFPTDVVEWMLDQQEVQGNKRDVSVFKRDRLSTKHEGGFDWHKTSISGENCNEIIHNRNFDLLFKHFPKKETKEAMKRLEKAIEKSDWNKQKQDYPKIMWCWDGDVSDADEFVVVGMFKDTFMCIEEYYLDEFEESCNNNELFNGGIFFYKNASETKPAKQYTKEQAEKEFNINIID